MCAPARMPRQQPWLAPLSTERVFDNRQSVVGSSPSVLEGLLGAFACLCETRIVDRSDLRALSTRLERFATERDWEKFHTPKDLAIALVVEVGELLEHFQWRSNEELQR